VRILAIICVFIASTHFAAIGQKVAVQIVQDTKYKPYEIPYSFNVLGWQHFTAVVPEQDYWYAVTNTLMGYGVKGTNYPNGDIIVEVSTKFYFDKKQSAKKAGVIDSQQSIYLLKHEQVHFDIAYIQYREYLDSLSKTVFTNKYRQQLSDIYRYYTSQVNLVQNAYDSATQHSLVVEEQLNWNDSIQKLVKTYLKN
jgi:hypothetical protein